MCVSLSATALTTDPHGLVITLAYTPCGWLQSRTVGGDSPAPTAASSALNSIYHVTSRGDRRESIFDDDRDRQMFLEIVGAALDRFDACALAYCLMGNHYHLVLHTRRANLSMLMRHVGQSR